MTKQRTIKTTDPDFPKYVKAYMDRLVEIVQSGKSDLVEEGHLGLLWHRAVPDLPRPMSCPDLELVPATKNGDLAGWAFFCHKVGCICTPMRTDMPGEYPDACPEMSIEDEIRYGSEGEGPPPDYEYD